MSSESDDGREAFPPGLWELVKDTAGIGMYQNIFQCPDCQAYYSNTNECGFMENDIELNRISPTEAGHILSEDEFENFRKDMEHPDAQSREYAAECLLDYYNEKDMTDEIAKLFKHPDKAIRLNSVVCLLRRDKQKFADIYKDVFDNDSDSQVRMNAGRYFEYNDEVVAQMIPYFVDKLKDDGIKYEAARILETYLYDGIEGLEDRRKIVKAEIKKQKIDLIGERFDYLRSKL
jgi:hypothetical protein